MRLSLSFTLLAGLGVCVTSLIAQPAPKARVSYSEVYGKNGAQPEVTAKELPRFPAVEPAKALGIDAGTIEPGKLADLVVLDGNPLTDVTATVRVRQVMANGKVYTLADLLAPR